MAWSLLAHTGQANAVTSSIDTTGADLIVAVIASYSSTPVTIQDSASNTWQNLTEVQAGSSNDHQRMFYVQSPTTNSAHTFSALSGNFYAIDVMAWSGSVATPLDGQNTNSDISISTIQPGSITPSQDGDLVISSVSLSADGASGQTWTIDSGFTITDQIAPTGGQHNGAAFAYLVQSVHAAINPTWTLSSGSGLAAAIAAFKAAAGGAVYVPYVSIYPSILAQ